MKVEDFKYNLIDEIFSYKGLWNIESKCGLKIIEKTNQVIVIVTELFADNPGSSVTDACTELANQICNEKQIDADKLFYVEHNPELNSRFSFLEESFSVVNFNIVDNVLSRPEWKSISRAEIMKMI